MSNFVVNNVDQ